MKRWFKENWFMILVWTILTVVFIGIVVLSLFMTKWIVESSLPEWLKMWLIIGGG